MVSELPRMPERPPERPAKSNDRSRFFVVFFAVGTLLSILAFVSLFFPGFAIVLGLSAGLLLLQYLVWGWWLGRIIRDSQPDED